MTPASDTQYYFFKSAQNEKPPLINVNEGSLIMLMVFYLFSAIRVAFPVRLRR